MKKEQVRKGLHFAFMKFRGCKYPVKTKIIEIDESYRPEYHCHDFPQIWYCARGRYNHQIEDTQITCEEKSLVIVPPGQQHMISYCGECAELWEINFSHSMLLNAPLENWINSLANLYLSAVSGEQFKYVTFCEESQKQVAKILSWLDLLMFSQNENENYSEIWEKVEKLFSLPELAIPKSQHKKVYNTAYSRILPIVRIMSYVNLHYPEKIQEEDLLRGSGISRRGMFRYFKDIVGCGYLQYLQQLRIKRACIYMRTNSYSLSYISDVCGFCNLQYMNRVFLQITGETAKSRQERIQKRKCRK